MVKKLLIVESPSKAKTLNKYLDNKFKVLASYGHVRDLIPKKGAVIPEDDFAMKYQLIEKNKKHIEEIIKAVKEADTIYLATDPDREGEAIAWHILEIIKTKLKKAYKDKEIRRVVFNEITKNAVQIAIENPRDISQDLVDAQLARRSLDYLVGFNLSPLLWKKIRMGLSAGRVQSPALRLICEREDEIQKFEKQEYWTIHLNTKKEKYDIEAKLTHLNNKKLEQFDIKTKEEKDQILNNFTDKLAEVINIERKKKSRKPYAPFTTSTMQQEASNKLNFPVNKTMRIAQQLYEGVDIGSGIVGLITYMRTDSTFLSNDAINEIRQYIENKFDKKYLPKTPNIYKTKAKNAQEAHEAIRATSILRNPEELKPFLTSDAYKLYNLIWLRTLSSQMANANFDTTSIDFKVNKGIFRSTGQIQIFDGFLKIYQDDENNKDRENILPDFNLNEKIKIDKIDGQQHFTQPPPRYSEATLVKTLEEYGIGRPSTYAAIISTLKDREYVTIDQKRFIPTDIGIIVNKFLSEHFDKYLNYHFTAELENELDNIAIGNKKWIPIMHKFWDNFVKQLKEKEDLDRTKITDEELDEICPQCKKHNLVIKLGRNGKFISCKGYPNCNYARNINEYSNEEKEIVEGKLCPKCEHQLIYRYGKYGKFIGCSNYPECKYIESLKLQQDTNINCPLCKTGKLIGKKSRYGKIFYGCNNYPKCNYAIWNEPIEEKCPKCEFPIMTKKTTKRKGTEKVCPQKECLYSEPFNE